MKRDFFFVARPLVSALCGLACLASVACGSDGADPKDQETDNITTKRDAGVKRDAGSAAARDAGKTKDAKVEESADDDAEDEEVSADDAEDDEDKAEDDTAAVAKDAGVGSKQDAGKPTSADAGTTAPGATASCAELTYATFGEMFLKTYCYECHSSKGTPLGNVVLDTRAGITKSMSILKKMVVRRADGREPAMPKGGNDALTDAERNKFGQWIDCGAK
jgi:hypothetical protein